MTFKSLEVDIGSMGTLPLLSTCSEDSEICSNQFKNEIYTCIIAQYTTLIIVFRAGVWSNQSNHFFQNYLHLTTTPSILFSIENFNTLIHRKSAFNTPAIFYNTQDYDKNRSELGIVLLYTKSSNGHFQSDLDYWITLV